MRPSRCWTSAGRRRWPAAKGREWRDRAEQLRFGGFALGQLCGVELADQSADFRLRVLAGACGDLRSQQGAAEQQTTNHDDGSPNLPSLVLYVAFHTLASIRRRAPLAGS